MRHWRPAGADDARAALGADALAAAWAVGRALSLDEAVAEAERVVAEPAVAATPFDLTARERDVLRLLVEGRTNPEIAAALFIGTGTVRTHVSSILGKLGVATRREAAALARQEQVV